MAGERGEGVRQVARDITALIREARELQGSDDEARRAEYFARNQELLDRASEQE